MIIGEKIREAFGIRVLSLEAKEVKCTKCNLCSEYCPMSLDAQNMVQSGSMYDSECILCGECVDRCAKNAIGFRFKPVKIVLAGTPSVQAEHNAVPLFRRIGSVLRSKIGSQQTVAIGPK